MAEKYPHLKTLKVALEFVNREGMAKTTEMKYSANPEHAKSVLVFVCPSSECCGGDFDLTAKLAEAVAKRRTKVAGEMHCLRTHKKASGEVAPLIHNGPLIAWRFPISGSRCRPFSLSAFYFVAN
jgi:hypothetical protein